MKTPWQIMTKGDWLIVLMLLGIALVGIAWLAVAPTGTRVIVTSGGKPASSPILTRPNLLTWMARSAKHIW